MRLSRLCDCLRADEVDVVRCPERDIELTGVAPLDEAQADQLSFLSNSKYADQLESTRAGAVLVRERDAVNVPAGTAAIVVDDPYYAYAIAARLLNPPPMWPDKVHETAQVSESASLGEHVHVGPNVVIGPECIIASGVVIEAGCVLGRGVRLAHGVHLEPNVVLHDGTEVGEKTRIKAGAVIGGDGFGFAPHRGRWQPVPQLGRVRIGARCSIGANVTIDRGALKDTVVEDDVIIDNLVHLGHNVRVGRGTAIVAQVGVSGSTDIGANCVLAGQVGTAGHLKITDGVQIMARGGVTGDVTEPGSYAGFPLMPQKEWQKMVVYERNLPKLGQTLKKLERTVAALEKKIQNLEGNTEHDDSH
ncbi:UDP-3-O-(3-hydroxymyristoyl)glucosamine N-acyltransferase [Sulfurivirga sp.]|uniref:UDP-3-O-(3-hydroxymyristoyl)glucosamine N-acyltransferase n=1 Tax=Sulfurivirga sp. TaxID=2614236 RepID=UPI0025F93AE9|nr:UDP-3-O-(3-hydroxymyristoyl)glucosamine N-acyltransferase [Sulfurivirga sp.]